MKILCVIDSLGSGGAQRQMVNLACGLQARGHDVEMFVYFPQYTFFRREIELAQIPIHEVKKGNRFSLKVIFRLAALFRKNKYDGVVSFLSVPNLSAELAKLLVLSRTPLIVGERSSSVGESNRFKSRLLRWPHYLASAVVANSRSQAEWLRTNSWLHSKTHFVYNGYTISRGSSPHEPVNRIRFRYLVVGRIQKDKNGIRLIEALTLYAKKHRNSPVVTWAGRQETDRESLQLRKEMDDRLKNQSEVGEKWEWLGERNDIPALIRKCDALIHVSLYEGLPNVICEAFIGGCPVIASNVCDHPFLIEEPARGFLCDPHSPESICEAIERFESQSDEQRTQQGTNARKFAEEYLSIEKMVSAYESLIMRLRDKANR
jgi:glycosyltransferase involved in cell wall biosynthesis